MKSRRAVSQWSKVLVSFFAFSVLALICPSRAQAGTPCCGIISINLTTGVVTAQVNVTGQQFEFKLSNPAQLKTLKVGQAVYANLTTGQVSLDGQHIVGKVISISSAPASKGVGTTPAQQGLGAATNPAAPCCGIIGIDNSSGVVTAKVNATGQQFQFKLSNPAQLGMLNVGQAIYANLAAKQVSLNGTAASGTILGISPMVTKVGGDSASSPSGSTGSSNSGNSGGSASGSGNTSSSPSPCSMPNTWPPNTADTYGKFAAAATVTCYDATCGATATISGNIFPAGSSDWLTFTVPASRANCANPVIQVSGPAGAGISFDMLGPNSFTTLVYDVIEGRPVSGVPVGLLGTVPSPPQAGTYYIRVYGSTIGGWTLTFHDCTGGICGGAGG